MGLDNAVVVDSSLFDSIVGDEKEAVIKYQMTMPFTAVKAVGDEDDVVVYGPVYVGDESMLDRHKELVDAQAIINSWNSYAMNPVILYNHRKDYGVIGVMESVEMGEFETPDGKTIPAVMGKAVIDGGEKDIVRKIRKGMLRSFSIGFIAKAAVKECLDKDKDNCYMKFTEIEWIETSVVDIPASPNALFDVQKSILSYGDFNKTSDCGKEACECSNTKKVVPSDEKHIIAVEERENSIVVEFAKHEMDMPMEDEGQPEGESLYSLRAEITELKETIATLMKSDRLNTHVDEPNTMTEELEVKSEEEVVVPTEEEIPTESVEIKAEEEAVEETVEEEAEEEVAEEVAEEEAAEEEVEELPEEVVEEVAEATEEEGVDEPVETKVLEEVVKSLVTVEATLSNLIVRLDETESLKSLLAEKDGIIATLTEEKSAAETEAAIEAEVGKRLAEKMADVGIAPTPEANKKSLTPTPAPMKKSGVTKFDPQPVMSEGMTGLGTWLETRLGQRGA